MAGACESVAVAKGQRGQSWQEGKDGGHLQPQPFGDVLREVAKLGNRHALAAVASGACLRSGGARAVEGCSRGSATADARERCTHLSRRPRSTLLR